MGTLSQPISSSFLPTNMGPMAVSYTHLFFGQNSYGFVLVPTDDNRLIFQKEYFLSLIHIWVVS